MAIHQLQQLILLKQVELELMILPLKAKSMIHRFERLFVTPVGHSADKVVFVSQCTRY